MENNNTNRDHHDEGDALEGLLTQQEVADILKVSIRHIAKMSASEKLPKPLKLGRSVRYLPRDIRTFLAGNWTPEAANKF